MDWFSTESLETIFHISTITVAILGGFGLMAALISAFSGYEVADRLQKESNVKISEANARAEEAKAGSAEANASGEKAKRDAAIALKQANEANAHLADANARAAQANERAAQAAQKAAEANLALEKYKAPRSLTKLQQDTIREKLKKISGVSVDVLNFGSTTEIVTFSALLVSILNGAGWPAQSWNDMGGGAATGIVVITKPDANENILKASKALVGALQDAGVVCNLHSVPEWNTQDKWVSPPGAVMGPSWESSKVAPIRLIIGAKPQ
jgi:hypothetical protein